MRRGLLIAAVLAFGFASVSLASTAPMSPAPSTIRHACTLTRCGHCPRGKWMCNGKCIPDNRACELR
jgi:hypothetical protein